MSKERVNSQGNAMVEETSSQGSSEGNVEGMMQRISSGTKIQR